MLAHVHIMKTAGQTICDILRKSFGADHCDLRVGDLATMDDIRFAKSFYPGLKSIAGHAVRPRGDLLHTNDIRFFVFLRDPIARCISHYQFEQVRNQRNVPFTRWLTTNSNYQTKILCGSEDPDKAIDVLQTQVGFVGLVEDFNQSLQLWKNWSGYDLVIEDYRSRNIASNQSIARELTSNSSYMQAIKQANEGDEVLYQFAKERLFPQQVACYGDDHPDLISCSAPSDASRSWATLKRNFLYKPLAKMRQSLRPAA